MSGKGLSLYRARRLAKGILLPTLLYRTEVLVLSRTMVGKMQKFWNRVARWVTNAFYSTNVTVLSTWSSTATTTQQTRLPMDEVAATAVAVFPDLKVPTKPSKLAQVTLEDAEAYVKAKERVRKMIWNKWAEWDCRPYYEYRPIFRDCWSFMTLPKFQAGRIHQMRAHKSYLNAQTNWSNRDRDVT